MPRTATRSDDPRTMSPAAIRREIKAIMQRHTLLEKLEKQIEQQHMDDTDRCIALRAALSVLTWPTRTTSR